MPGSTQISSFQGHGECFWSKHLRKQAPWKRSKIVCYLSRNIPLGTTVRRQRLGNFSVYVCVSVSVCLCTRVCVCVCVCEILLVFQSVCNCKFCTITLTLQSDFVLVWICFCRVASVAQPPKMGRIQRAPLILLLVTCAYSLMLPSRGRARVRKTKQQYFAAQLVESYPRKHKITSIDVRYAINKEFTFFQRQHSVCLPLPACRF